MEWTRGPTIGRGASAAVSLAIACCGGLFAVKSADLSSSALLRREEALLSQLCSPYIVKCFGSDITCENGKHVFNVFLEYVSGGTLSELIKKRGGHLEETAIRLHARQLLMGLDYLQRKEIVHGDIKGRNILISDGGLKIADFGCAKWSGSGAAAAISGTPAYMAPEVARGEEQGFPADVWAFGCTVIEMATGSNPWPEMKDPAAVLYRIAYSGDVPEFPRCLSDDARDLLAKCLALEPKDRWTAGELLQHRFFDSTEENFGEIGEITRRTPTSVMDGGFWNVLEASDCYPNPSEIDSSPAGRIRDLIGDGTPAELSLPSWTEEEDWLTVRGNGGLIGSESVTVISVDDEVIVTSVITEDCLNGDGGNDSAFPVMSVKYKFVFRKANINKINSLTMLCLSITLPSSLFSLTYTQLFWWELM